MLRAVCSGEHQNLVIHQFSSPAQAPGGAWRWKERNIRQRLPFLVLNVFAVGQKLFEWRICGEGMHLAFQVMMRTRTQCSMLGDPT